MATMFEGQNRRTYITMNRLFQLFLLLTVFTLGSRPAHAAISWVSASHAVCTQPSSGANSQTCTLPASTTAGNDIVVGISWQNTGATIAHVYGSGTASYFPLYATVCGSGECVATVVCHHCAAQSAITTTMSEGTAFVTTVGEYSGVAGLGATGTNTVPTGAPALSMATSDANALTVCTTATVGSISPATGTGNLRSAASAGSIAGATGDSASSLPGSPACAASSVSGESAAAGVVLLATTPKSYIWPDCDTTHPCVIYHEDTVSSGTAENEKPNPFKMTVVPSSAGNLLEFTVTHVSGKTITLSDNSNNNWQTAVTTTNASGGIETEVRYVCGAAAGTNVITVQLSQTPSPGEILQFSYNEVSGIAPSSCLDTVSGANGLTGNLQPGTLNTTSDGDLVYNFAETSYNYPEEENPIGWVTADSSSALLMENPWDMFASQVSVQATHGAYNPTLYVNSDPNKRLWNSVAAAFKASSGAGTQPTGIHVTRVMHYYNPPLPLSPATLPFPVTGNAVVITSAYPSSNYEGDMTNVGDSQGDTWTRTPFTIADENPQVYYTCLGTQTGSRDLTISWLPDTGVTHMIVYDVAGAATTGGASGCVGATAMAPVQNQANTANAPMVNAPVITPQSSNSVILAVNMTGIGPPSGTLTPGVVFVSIWATGMTDASLWDSGDCYGYIYTSSTSPIAFNWSMANSNLLPNGGSAYDGAAIEILPGTSAASPPTTTPTLSVTNSPVTYNGSPQAASVSASVAGTVSNILYNGSATVPSAAGTYAITANFVPTNTTTYGSLTGASAGNFVINKATPSVALTSSANPSIVNASVTFTATVPSSATGSVTFNNGTTSLGSVALSGGKATLSTTTLPAGSDSITAAYSGDGNDNAASSGVLLQTVNSGGPTTPTITWATPAPVTYGTALSGTQLNASASVAGSFAYSPAATTVLTAGPHTLSVTFTPTDTTDYKTATASVMLTVNKATPSITTLPTASAINYGQTLASSTLSGGAGSTSGSFTWTNPTTLPFAGNQPESVTFTPSDSADYNTAAGTVTVAVNKGAPSITTLPTASAITYGQTLASSALSGGTASVSGSFAWTSSTTLPFAGNQPESVTFTPADSTDYGTAVVTVTVIVNKATSSITTLPAASPITYGQALASSTLSGGKASVSGSFTWTSPATLPAVGAQAEGVTFTPSDTTDYNSAVATVTVAVSKGVPSLTTLPAASAINYGQPLASSALSGGAASVPGSFTWTAPTTLPPAGNQPEGVTFTPSDTTNYNTAGGMVTVTINKGMPSITSLPTASSISYGQTLASSALSGGAASVPGSFTWTSPAALPFAGTQPESVTFTPSDSTDYSTATALVAVTVSKGMLSITTWPTATAITYGQSLTASTLSGGKASVAGSFIWTSPTALPSAGAQPESVTFMPSDSTDYNSAQGLVAVTVNKAVPTITTLPTAGAITYGQTLASSALIGGSASVPGRFAWTSSAIAPLAGTPAESVTFTPSDTTDYSSTTGAVVVQVNKVTPKISWATPSSIRYGTALSGTQLNASSSVPGVFVYSPAAGTVLSPGSHTLTVTFTPTDSTDYATATSSVTLVVRGFRGFARN